jgi:hypothetical protein
MVSLLQHLRDPGDLGITVGFKDEGVMTPISMVGREEGECY